MNVVLSPLAEKIIRDQLESGQFDSPDQVVEEALQQMQGYQDVEELDDETMAAINEGQAEIDRGEGMALGIFKAELRKRTGLKLP
jgi:Arc/MetJ-type ribon-helix-helix transcriptional regulator